MSTNMADKQPKPHPRGANWTENETVSLVDTVVRHHFDIEGRLKPELTKQDKELLWRDVLISVNCEGKGTKSCEQIKKKWSDVKSLTKAKEKRRRKMRKMTGGGRPMPDLTSWEEKVKKM